MASGENHGLKKHPDAIPRGEKRPFAKLSAEWAREIKTRLARSENQYDIAELYGISQTTVSKIKRGIKWSHV